VAPLVSVGIPTYNRRATLERAVRSVLDQDERDLEVIVSDDASSDDTAAAMERLAAADARVRFTRQPVNLGHAGNYAWVLDQARGEHFMWLADDDWLDASYVRRCLETLRGEPGTVLACGQARYYVGERFEVEERPIDLPQRRAGERVLRYFARVNMNGPLFGVARRSDWAAVGFPDQLGGDWTAVAGMAGRGRVRTLTDVHVHRSMEGLGGDAERIARSFGFTGLLARHHHLWVAKELFRTLRPRHGLAVAAGSDALVLARFEGPLLGRRVGLGPLEQRLIRWVRSRDTA
jgi:Glycosyl transferase family 2